MHSRAGFRYQPDHYGLLCVLKDQRNEFTLDKINYRDNYGNYYIASSGLQPYTVLTALAYSTIKAEHFGEYFCPNADQCTGEEEKARWIAFANVHKAWGGINANETASVQAVSRFVDKELPKLFEWADTLSCDVAITVPLLEGAYDSAAQAMTFNYVATPFSMPTSESGSSLILKKPRKHLSKEAIVSTPEGTPLPFFAIVNGSYSGARYGGSGQLPQGYGVASLPYFLTLNTDNISIFADELLKEEVGKASVPEGTTIRVINGGKIK